MAAPENPGVIFAHVCTAYKEKVHTYLLEIFFAQISFSDYYKCKKCLILQTYIVMGYNSRDEVNGKYNLHAILIPI